MATQKVLVLDGTSNLPKELTPNTSSAGSGDAGKLVALGTDGKLDDTMLPSSSGGASLSLTASEAIAAGALVNIDSTGKIRNANATDATKPAMGFVLAAVASSASGTVYFGGNINSGASGLTEGSPVYLSAATAGAATATAPSSSGNLIQQVSPCAVSSSEFVFAPAPGIIKG
jgi:hypothetical protein